MNPKYPTPRDYLLSRDYKTLSVPSVPELIKPKRDLELAIVGYVSSPDTPKEDLPDFPLAVSYGKIEELIFEYLKINEPDKIKQFIQRNKYLLGGFYRDSQGGVEAQRLKAQFTQLQSSDISEITYSDFHPNDFITLTKVVHKPFREYCNGRLQNLVKPGILIKKRVGRYAHYVRLNPSVDIVRASDDATK